MGGSALRSREESNCGYVELEECSGSSSSGDQTVHCGTWSECSMRKMERTCDILSDGSHTSVTEVLTCDDVLPDSCKFFKFTPNWTAYARQGPVGDSLESDMRGIICGFGFVLLIMG